MPLPGMTAGCIDGNRTEHGILEGFWNPLEITSLRDFHIFKGFWGINYHCNDAINNLIAFEACEYVIAFSKKKIVIPF